MPRIKDEWISTTEAAEMLGCTTPNVTYLARKGRIKSRRAHPLAAYEILRSSVVAYRPDFMSSEKKESPAKKPRAVKHVPEAEADAALPSTVDTIRWVLEGRELGRFTPEQALDQIADLVAE
jgi:hypothetical protein